MKRKFRSIFGLQILFSGISSLFVWVIQAIIKDITTNNYNDILSSAGVIFKQVFSGFPVFQLSIYTFSITLPCAIVTYRFFRALRQADDYLELYASYLTNLSEHIDLLPNEGSLTRIVQLFFHELVPVFQEISSASFFIIDVEQTNYLKMIASYEVREDDKANLILNWNSEKEEVRGVAGHAFFTQSVQHVKFHQLKTGFWIPDKYCYIFTSDYRKSEPGQESMLAIPILQQKNGNTKCLGVVCLDSKNPNFFESEKTQTTLKSFVNPLSVAIKTSINC